MRFHRHDPVSLNRPKPGHDEIANDIVRFLANGGQIQKLEIGETAERIQYRRSTANTSHIVRTKK